MLKLHLIYIISITSCFLLTIQWITLEYISQKAKPEPNFQLHLIKLVINAAAKYKIPLFVLDKNVLRHASNLSDTCLGYDSPNPYEEKENSNVKVSKKGLPNFPLFDSITSPGLVPVTYKNRKCPNLCDVRRKVTHFATLAEFVSSFHLLRLIEHLRKHQLTCIELAESAPELVYVSIGIRNCKHLIIFDEKQPREQSFLVHISVLDETMQHFWYSEPLIMNEHDKRLVHRQGARKLDFQFDEHSQIYEKTGLKARVLDGLNIFYPEDPQPYFQSSKQIRFQKCNQTRAKIFHATHGLNSSPADVEFKMNAYQLLKRAKMILDELKIPFWLSSGTCLGYYRQCDFITYSGDVDIGIFAWDYREEMIDAFLMHDLPLIHRFGKSEDSFELSFRNEHLKLDVFFFYEEEDFYWNGGTQAKTGLKFKYKFPKFELCWTDFMDLLVRVPCDTLMYIKANYGPNWEEPIKEWDWKQSPNNVQPNGQWNPDEWQHVIQLNVFP